jgi:hypothetical protein
MVRPADVERRGGSGWQRIESGGGGGSSLVLAMAAAEANPDLADQDDGGERQRQSKGEP